MSDVVSIDVASQRISGWTGVTIEWAIDNCADAFSISAPFDPERADLRERFKPFRYQPCEVYIDDERIITGSIEKVGLIDSEDGQTIIVEGRNKTGVIVDCYIDEVGYQLNNQRLADILNTLVRPYGIEVNYLNNTDIIQECVAEPGQKIFDFALELAENYGLFLYSDATGRLVLSYPPKAETPVASIVAGKSPYIGGSASYDGTARFSMYTVISSDYGTEGVARSAEDFDMPKHVYRHSVELLKSSSLTELKNTARYKRSRALARAASIDITVSGWRDGNGALWKKGKTITLLAPALMVHREYDFILAGITLKIDETQGRVTDLRLVLPQTFEDDKKTPKMPEVYPWS